jgi:hypothetical protein
MSQKFFHTDRFGFKGSDCKNTRCTLNTANVLLHCFGTLWVDFDPKEMKLGIFEDNVSIPFFNKRFLWELEGKQNVFVQW